MKTIFSRITTLKASRDILDSVGVSVKDIAGKVRPVSAIIADLAGKWNNLSDEQRQNLGVQIAGRQQLTRFLALMNNYDRAIEATKTSINSQGSAMREQSKFAESLEGRLNRLDTAWNKFTLSMGEAIITDGLISVISALNEMASGLSVVVKHATVLGTIMGTLGVLVALFSTKFKMAIGEIIAQTVLMKTAFIADQFGLTALAGKIDAVTFATNGMGVAIRSLASATVVGAIFVGLGIALEKVVKGYSEAKQAQEDFEEAEKKNVDALTSNKLVTMDLIDKYKKMSKERDKAGDSWSVDKEQTYLSIQQQLGDLYPALIKNIDASGKAHLKTAEAIDKEVKATQKLIDKKKNEARKNAEDNFATDIGNKKENERTLKGLQGTLKMTDPEKTGGGSKAVTELRNRIRKLKNDIDKDSAKIVDDILQTVSAFNDTEINPEVETAVENFISSLDLSKIEDSPKKLKEFSENIAILENKMQKAYENGDEASFNDARNKLLLYGKEMSNSKHLADALDISYAKLKKHQDELAKATYNGRDAEMSLDDALGVVGSDTDTLSQSLEDAKGNFNAIKDVINDMVNAKNIDMAMTTAEGEAYKSLADELSPVNELLEKVANGKSISASEAMDLIQKEKDLAGAISIENGQVTVNEKAVKDLRDTKIKAYQDMISAIRSQVQIETTAEHVINGVKQKGLVATLQANGIQIKSILNVAEATLALSEIEKQRAEQMERINNSGASGAMHASQAIDKQYGDFTNSVNTIKKAYQDLDNLSNTANLGLQEVGTSLADSSKDNTYVTDKYKMALDDLNTSIAQQQALQEKYSKYSSKYQASIKAEIDLLKQKKALLEQQTKDLQAQIKAGKITSPSVKSSNSTTNYTVTPSTNTYSPSSTSASGNSTQAYIWNYLRSQGLSDGAIAGVMGNLMQESSLNPKANNGKGNYGIAQWGGGRLKGLQNYARQNGTSMYDLQTQLGWLMVELSGGDSTTTSILKKYGGISGLNKMSPSDSARVFEEAFERSGGSALSKRQSNANSLYSQFTGKTNTTTTNTSSPSLSNTSSNQESIDDAKNQVNQLQQDLLDVQSQIEQLNLLMVENVAETYDFKIDSYKDDMAKIDTEQAKVKQTSQAWRTLEAERKREFTKQAEYEQQAIDYLNQQIKLNNDLTEAQKQQLQSEVTDRQQQLAQLQASINESQQAIIDSENSVADAVIDAMKEYYQQREALELKEKDKEIQNAQDAHDAKIKLMDDELEQYKKVAQEKLDTMQDQNATEDYNTELSKKQKDRQGIQNKINQLSLDKSMEGQKKLADLKQQLTDKDQEIADFMRDRQRTLEQQAINDAITNKEDETKQKENVENDYFNNLQNQLQTQRNAIEQHYTDLIDDEKNWNAIRQQILNDNISGLSKTLSTFIDDTNANIGTLGTAIQDNLILKLTEAQSMINDFNNTYTFTPPPLPASPQPTPTPTPSTSTTSTSSSSKPSTTTSSSNSSQRKTTTSLNFRSGASYGNNVMSVLPKDAIVTYLGMVNGWAKVQYKGKTGYVGSNYLKAFKTGGFTGDWFGNEGKVALLHKKELILKENDTSNLLDAIKFTKEFVNNLKDTMPRILSPNPNAGSGNTVEINVTIENMQGGEKGVTEFLKAINTKLKGKGGLQF